MYPHMTVVKTGFQATVVQGSKVIVSLTASVCRLDSVLLQMQAIAQPAGADCDKTKLGAGIHTVTIRGDEPADAITPDPDNPPAVGDTSASNYCLSTGSRAAYTPLGGGTGEQTKICLIPQRWYENCNKGGMQNGLKILLV